MSGSPRLVSSTQLPGRGALSSAQRPLTLHPAATPSTSRSRVDESAAALLRRYRPRPPVGGSRRLALTDEPFDDSTMPLVCHCTIG